MPMTSKKLIERALPCLFVAGILASTSVQADVADRSASLPMPSPVSLDAEMVTEDVQWVPVEADEAPLVLAQNTAQPRNPVTIAFDAFFQALGWFSYLTSEPWTKSCMEDIRRNFGRPGTHCEGYEGATPGDPSGSAVYKGRVRSWRLGGYWTEKNTYIWVRTYVVVEARENTGSCPWGNCDYKKGQKMFERHFDAKYFCTNRYNVILSVGNFREDREACLAMMKRKRYMP